jgi:type II secretory pathway component PulK
VKAAAYKAIYPYVEVVPEKKLSNSDSYSNGDMRLIVIVIVVAAAILVVVTVIAAIIVVDKKRKWWLNEDEVKAFGFYY